MTSVSSPPLPPHTSGPRSADWGGGGGRNSNSTLRNVDKGRNRGRGGSSKSGSNNHRDAGSSNSTKPGQLTLATSTTDKALPTPVPPRIQVEKVNVKTAARDSAPSATKPVSSSALKPASLSSSKPATSAESPSRPRNGGRRQSAHTPKMPLPASVAISQSFNAPKSPSSNGPSARSSTRRRRPKAQALTTPASKQDLTSLTTQAATPHFSPTAVPVPPAALAAPTGLVKDAPPHLATRPDDAPKPPVKDTLRIDSLVEHVRSMAMDRPTTPNTPGHIDWAGDDDDTLPDLDDWGVTSTTASGDSHSPLSEKLLSPLLSDSLKQLPLHNKSPNFAHPTLAPLTNAAESEVTFPADAIPEVTIIEPPIADSPPAPAATPGTKSANDATSKPSIESSVPVSAPSSHMVHPLPAKPTPAKPLRNHAPPLLASSPLANSTKESPASSGLISADSQVESVKLQITAKPPRAPGLEASIHAPQNAKSDSALAVPPLTAPPFNPSHSRSRTLGRAGFGEGGAPGRQARSGNGMLSHGSVSHHGRTQSTPPASVVSPGHARHASRPVITGDAISRLARTLGGAPPRKDPNATSAVSASTTPAASGTTANAT